MRRLLVECGLFDGDWYVKRYHDVPGRDPLEHYLRFGAAEGRDPGPRFNARLYIQKHPDIGANGLNPLVHLLDHYGVDAGQYPPGIGVVPDRRSCAAPWPAEFEPAVSVIVPCYNHAEFLPQRFETIFGQTYQNFEVIILDDCSPDATRDVIQQYAGRPNVRVVLSNENSGSTFAQWIRGIDLARHDLIWIAEDDDYCELDLLQRLLPSFCDPDVKLAYSQSTAVDDAGSQLFDYATYTDEFSLEKWRADYVVTGTQELNDGLAVKNTIPNASAAVFRKFDLRGLRGSLPEYRLVGDWLFYIHAIRRGKIAFCADPLNYHRRHQATCIVRYGHEPRGYQETAQVHECARAAANLSDATLDAMEFHLERVRQNCQRAA